MFTQKDLWPENGDEGQCWVGESHTKGIQLDNALELGTRYLASIHLDTEVLHLFESASSSVEIVSVC